MKSPLIRIASGLAAAGLLLAACGNDGPAGLFSENTVTISIVYGSEKREWLEPLVAEYNAARHTTPGGAIIVVEATPMGSIESVYGILEERLKPVVWSPASSVYIPVANAEWRKTRSSDLVAGKPNDLVLSPVVIAMWRSMAEALGWPDKPIGWADIAALATSSKGWAEYGYPEWGQFKFGHTHPDFSNSGIVSILAIAYAGAGKQRGLTQADLARPEVRDFMEQVERSIIHYGSSTGFFGERMFERGPSYLSAAVLYENLVVAQEKKRLAGQSAQLPVVAIYPKEGAFWTNNPYVILNAPWVTEEQKTAAQAFEKFLLDRPQQLRAIELGFRPADPAIPLGAPLDAQHGVDPTQPRTVLEVPSAQVIQSVQQLWRQTKKPVDVVALIDISGSMKGDKISTARTSLIQFINLLSDRDRLQVTTFASQVAPLTPLSALSDKRTELTRRVSGIVEGGNTRLYDAVIAAHQELQANGDPNHIRAIVVLSDGKDTASTAGLDEALTAISDTGEEGGAAIKLFTIGFGEDADREALKRLAEATGGKQYDSTPDNIHKIYAEIATFF